MNELFRQRLTRMSREEISLIFFFIGEISAICIAVGVKVFAFDRTHSIYVVCQSRGSVTMSLGYCGDCGRPGHFRFWLWNLGLTDALGLDVMLVSIRCQTICSLQSHGAKNRHVGTQETHWDKTNKELTSFKMAIFFVCFVPVRLLRPNKAVFVPCDCKLQRAYREFQNYEVITMSVVGGQLTEKKKKKKLQHAHRSSHFSNI